MAIDCTFEHWNITKYAQILVQYNPHVQNFQNLKITLTRSQNRKNLGPTLSVCCLLFGPKLLINARTFDVRVLINAETLAPRFANWLPKFDGILFSAFGPTTQGHKVQHSLVTCGRLKRLTGRMFLLSSCTCFSALLGSA
jgi:hypothetical protein